MLYTARKFIDKVRVMIRLYFLSLLLSLSSIAWAQEVAQNSPEQAEAGDTLTTLQKFTKLRSTLEAQVKEIERQLGSSPSDSDKKELQKDLAELQGELDSLKENWLLSSIGNNELKETPPSSGTSFGI